MKFICMKMSGLKSCKSHFSGIIFATVKTKKRKFYGKEKCIIGMVAENCKSLL